MDANKQEALLELIAELRMSYGKLQELNKEIIQKLHEKEQEVVKLNNELHTLQRKIFNMTEELKKEVNH